MSNFAENKEERVFEFYSNFPQEVQMMVVDEMQADDRCRLRRCSKLCDKQARSSKKFINEIMIIGSQNFVYIIVRYNKSTFGEPKHGFTLEFKKESEKNVMRYLNRSEELWRLELCQSTDLLQLAVEVFKRSLEVHQNSVKSLEIRGKDVWEKLESVGFGVESLRNLEDICGMDILIKPLFPMLRRPLKDLTVFWMDDNENENLPNCKEIYQVREMLYIPSLKLNNEQFLRLTASYIEIHIGYLAVEDILSFIKSWRNGLVRDNLKFCDWGLYDSNFDSDKVFRRCGGVTTPSSDREEVRIKNNKNPSNYATLIHSRSSFLRFSIQDVIL